MSNAAGRGSDAPRSPPARSGALNGKSNPSPSTAARSRIGQDLAGRVRPRRTGDPATGMGTGPRQVQTGQSEAIPGMAEHGPPGEELIQAGFQVLEASLGEPVLSL